MKRGGEKRGRSNGALSVRSAATQRKRKKPLVMFSAGGPERGDREKGRGEKNLPDDPLSLDDPGGGRKGL